ncbi:MAG: DUF502 domain-containing protein [Alphaproteobacteria bacterium]
MKVKTKRDSPEKLPPCNPGTPRKTVKPSLFARLRTYFLAGVIVTAPVSITIYISWLFITFVDSKVTPLIPVKYNPETYLPFTVPGLGLVVVIVAMILIGAVAAGYIGRVFVHWGERLLARMPVVRNIYSALKQIFETVFAEKSRAFRQVVLIEYPRKGSWALGFATGTTKGEVQKVIDDEVVNIFLPTTPNPTSGYLLFLPRRDVTFLSMTVEEGIKMVISGGVVEPGTVRPPEESSEPAIPAEPEKAPALVGEAQRR